MLSNNVHTMSFQDSGQQLRQDDPSALRDIIQIVQSRASAGDDEPRCVNYLLLYGTHSSFSSSRTRFMIETLTNLKNNKLKRNVAQNQGGAAVERMKKFLSNLTKSRHGMSYKWRVSIRELLIVLVVLAHEPLRVSLEDLHSAETKGKWWLVGAAWGGDPLVDKQAEFSMPVAQKSEKEAVSSESADLMKLARVHGMNTDIRRGIFVVLMSSDVCIWWSIVFARWSYFLGLCWRMREAVSTEADRGSATWDHSRATPLLWERESLTRSSSLATEVRTGKIIQSLLHSGLPATLPHLAFIQNHATIQSMGFSSGSWRKDCWRRRCYQECGW